MNYAYFYTSCLHLPEIKKMFQDEKNMFYSCKNLIIVCQVIDFSKVTSLNKIINADTAEYCTNNKNIVQVCAIDKNIGQIVSDKVTTETISLFKTVERAFYYKFAYPDDYTGSCVDWYTNGVIRTRSGYYEGKRNGICTQWTENNIIESKGSFLNGKLIGSWQYFDVNGNIEKEELYFGEENEKCILKRWLKCTEKNSQEQFQIGNNCGIPYTVSLVNGKIKHDDYYDLCFHEHGHYNNFPVNMFMSLNSNFIVILTKKNNWIEFLECDDNCCNPHYTKYKLENYNVSCIFNKFSPKETFHKSYFPQLNTDTFKNCFKTMECAFYQDLDILSYYEGKFKSWNYQGFLIIDKK